MEQSANTNICKFRFKTKRRVYMFFEQTRIFQEGLSKRHVFFKEVLLFVERTLLSYRTFSRKFYLVFEHIQFSRRPPMPRTHRYFPGRYPLLNRYFVDRSRWLLSFVGFLLSALWKFAEKLFVNWKKKHGKNICI